jgi:hypothetical protein
LTQRDEGDVENEHADWADVVFDYGPAIVFASDGVTAFAPVVESQAHAPDDGDSHYMVEAQSWQAIEIGPDGVVYIVEGGDDAPQTVDLRVVLVDFRHDKDEGRQE